MAKLFPFTQTSIKDFEAEDTCPFRWHSQWVKGEIPFASNENMDKGKYFEQLFIGGSAKQNDEITDLPRLQNGSKSIDQIRIESQAERAKRLFTVGEEEFLGFTITRVQEKIVSKTTGREGTLDIVATDENGATWVIDVKLTKDLTNTRTQYGWGNEWDQMDLLQQLHYEALYEEKHRIRPKMALLVFDYSPQKRIEFGEIVISEKKRLEKEIRFQAAEEAFMLYEDNGWTKIPSLKQCEACPLKCDKRLSGSQVIKKVINY